MSQDRYCLRLKRRLRRTSALLLERTMNLSFPTFNACIDKEEKEGLKIRLKEGDVLLKDDCRYPLSQLSARVLRSGWIHSGIYRGDGKGIDIGSKPHVSEVSVDDFLNASKIAVLRPWYQEKEDVESVIAFLTAKLGKPFNSKFDLSKKHAFYCTQLIYESLRQMPHPIDLHVSKVFGQPAILCADIEKSNQIELVKVVGISARKRALVHLPSVSLMLIGGSLASKLNPAWSVCGAFSGLVASLIWKNKSPKSRRKVVSRHAS